MNGWWIVGCLTAAVLALASVRYRRRRAERLRIGRIRAAVERSLSATLTPAHEVTASPSSAGPRTPDGTTALDTPDREQSLPGGLSPTGPAGRLCRPARHRVVLSDGDLSATLGPGWRFQ